MCRLRKQSNWTNHHAGRQGRKFWDTDNIAVCTISVCLCCDGGSSKWTGFRRKNVCLLGWARTEARRTHNSIINDEQMMEAGGTHAWEAARHLIVCVSLHNWRHRAAEWFTLPTTPRIHLRCNYTGSTHTVHILDSLPHSQLGQLCGPAKELKEMCMWSPLPLLPSRPRLFFYLRMPAKRTKVSQDFSLFATAGKEPDTQHRAHTHTRGVAGGMYMFSHFATVVYWPTHARAYILFWKIRSGVVPLAEMLGNLFLGNWNRSLGTNPT